MRSIGLFLVTGAIYSICAAEPGGSAVGSGIVSGYMSVLDIVDPNVKSRPMSFKDLKFISDRLYLDKLANNLDCEVKVQEIKQEKKFSTGTKIVEMLKVSFKSARYRSDEQVAFFSLGVPLTIQSKNSPYAGVVEEFKIESNDLYNSQLIFQHNGNGQIIWVNYISDLASLPCGVK